MPVNKHQDSLCDMYSGLGIVNQLQKESECNWLFVRSLYNIMEIEEPKVLCCQSCNGVTQTLINYIDEVI